MRVLLAGATGAIGRPLIRGLKQNGHSVFCLVRSAESTRTVGDMGVEALIGDALDAASVRAAVAQARPDAVINELTSLPRHYTPAEMKSAAERDSRVRREGNINLLAGMRESGVRRYILQASGFWYAPGLGLADESLPLAVNASPGVAAGARTYVELESTAFRTSEIDCVAMRYGFFYGPGTWYTSAGDMGRNKHLQTKLIEAANMAPRYSPTLALLHDREEQKGNANRATLAVARKLVAYLMAVDRGQTHFLVIDRETRTAA